MLERTIIGVLALAGLVGCRSGDPPAPSVEDRPPAFERPRGDPTRGRRIFSEGVSPSGAKIEAVLTGDVIMDAATMPCVGCHGEDGLGRPEGGLEPSNITWEALSKPYGGRGQDGREHAAYDLASLRKAITIGVDPSGNSLHPSMPRYRMASADLDDLIAYLQVLGEPWAVGISDSTIALLTILPAADPTVGIPAVEQVLRAYFTEVNDRGGVFGRRLELDVLRLASGSPIDAQLAELRSRLVERPPFAVIAPHMGEAEAALIDWLAREQVPVIGPASNHPILATPPAKSVFHVDGGIPAQALALAEFATRERDGEQAEPVRAVVVHGPIERERELASRVLATWEAAAITTQAIEIDGEPAKLDAEIVLFLGPAAAVPELLATGESVRTILLPGSLGVGDPFALPRPADAQVFLAYPWLPDDATATAMRDYEALVAAHDLPSTQRPAQLATLTASTILIEALARAGRGVTRASLVDTLERFSDFQTGLTPPITYGPNQRVGLHDVRIVRVDHERGQLVRERRP